MSTTTFIQLNVNKNFTQNFKFSIRKSMHISFAIFPLSILLFYVIEDKNARPFEKEFIYDYRHGIYDNVVYQVAVFMSTYTLLVTNSVSVKGLKVI